MNTADCAFAIGADHAVCEDYGLSHCGIRPEPSFVALADGCSSSVDTDIGARLLCHAVARRFKLRAGALRANPDTVFEPPFAPDAVVRDADAWRAIMRLPVDALDATVAVIYENETGAAEVKLVGDGVVAARRRDGRGIDYVEVNCSLNAPTYLSYLVKRAPHAGGVMPLQAYQAAGGGVRQMRVHNAGAPQFVVDDRTWTDLRLDASGDAKSVALEWTFEPDAYDVVAVMTDGVSSFRKVGPGGTTPVPVPDVLRQLMGFKTSTAGFVKRRLRRFLKRYCQTQNWRHSDDLAIGALALRTS